MEVHVSCLSQYSQLGLLHTVFQVSAYERVFSRGRYLGLFAAAWLCAGSCRLWPIRHKSRGIILPWVLG